MTFNERDLTKASSKTHFACLTIVLAVLLSAPAIAVKADKVVLQNGDHLTGEIKKVEHGLLLFKTTATDKVEIRWEFIAKLTSKQRFEIEVKEGIRYYGYLGEPRPAGKIRIVDDDGNSTELDPVEVVRILQIKDRFWGRIVGEVSVGFNYTQSSDVTQFSFDGNARYKAEKYLVDLGFSTITTEQETGTTSRSDLTLLSQRMLQRRWFTGALIALQSNEELGIDQRVLLGGGVGRYLIQTSHNQLSTAIGLAVNREDFEGLQDSDDQLEGVLSVRYLIFRKVPREISLTAELRVFSSITDAPRSRVESNIDYTHEISRDFFLGLLLYSSYDSRPPTLAADSDHGIVASVGYKF